MSFITRIFPVLCAALLSGLLLSSSVTASISKETESQRKLFLEAEKALQLGQTDKFESLKKQLKDYPLYPYLIHKDLHKNLHRQTDKSIQSFLETYEDTPLARRLRSTWLKQLGKTHRWKRFLTFYQEGMNETINCYYLNALLNTQQQTKAWPLITKTWLHEESRPPECDPVFKQWKKAGYQTNDLVWERIALAIENDEISLARYLSRYLDKQNRIFFDQWLNARKKPEALTVSSISSQHPYLQLAYVHGIEKLARKDLSATIELWDQLRRDVIQNPQLIARVETRLSLKFLNDATSDEYDYLVFAEPCHDDTKLQEIRIRAALLNRQWPDVLSWIKRLPEGHRNNDRWSYWRARALQMTGQHEQANALFEKVAQERSYYGFMAADARGIDYSLNHAPIETDEKVLAEVKNTPGIKRARELLALERYLDARREWYFITRIFDQDELIAAAKLAHEWQWHDRAIASLARAKAWNDLGIRFPVKHRQQVVKAAKDKPIDAPWIYAMMRQESAFMRDAQSSAGALGLMQLMPRTADSVARKLKLHLPSKQDLFKPEKNIHLGTTYLEEVYQQLDKNPVLAIAAYNAGPHRVKRWLPENTMPADIWIELVPFRETRNYVKSVLAYTVIYAEKLGIENFKIKQRMPEIIKEASFNQLAARK
jgi:soluble lytic murein transglycosylase